MATRMTAALAWARDTTRLEPPVCFNYIYTNVFLGPLNALKR
jgi:hypothetical protein